MNPETSLITEETVQKLLVVTEDTPATLWTSDADGNATFVTRAWMEWTGKPPEFHLGNSWTRFILEEDRATTTFEFLKQLKQRKHFDHDFRMRRADGRIRWCNVAAEPYYQEDGSFIGYIGYCSDISDRKEKEQKLKENEERIRFALEATGIGTWDLDPENNILRWDDRCRELYGSDGNDVIAFEEVIRNIYPEDRSMVMDAMTRAMDPSGSGDYKTEFRTIGQNQQKLRWLRCCGKAYFNEHKIAYRFAGTVQDITEEKFKEEALRNVEQGFQTAFEHAALGIVMTDMDGRFFMVNRAFSQFVNYQPEELYGNTFELITLPDDREESRKLIKQLRDGEVHSFAVDKRYLTKDGNIVWGNMNATLMERSGQKILFGIVRNINAEITYKAQQEKLLTLVNNSVELMAILEMDGKNSYINKAGRDLLGFKSEEEVLKTSISELHTPEDDAFVKNVVLPAILDEGHWAGEMKVKKLDTGEVFPVFHQSVRIDDPKTGQPIAIGAIMRDMRPEMEQQQALIESARRFRSMIEQSPVAMGVFLGEDLIIDSANKGLLELWDKTPEVIGLPFTEALPEVRDQPFPELLRQVMRTGIVRYGYETRADLIRGGERQECYFNFVYAPYIEEGKITGVQVSAFEVTLQVKAKKALEASEERFRNLILQAPVATGLYTGAEMKISMANKAMMKLWGKDPSVIGKTLREALPELEGQPFLGLLDKVFKTGIPYTAMEDPATLMVDGQLQTNFFNFTYKPLRDSDGTIYAILNMAVDVTELVVARKKVEEQEAYFRRMTDTVPNMIWVTDINGHCTYLNAKWYEYTGQQAEKALGLGWLDAIHPDDKEEAGKKFIEANKNRQPYYFLYRLKNMENQYRWFLDIGGPRFTPEGTFEGMTGSVLDIDESKKAQEKLADAEERLRLAADGTGLATWDLDLKQGNIIYSPRLNEIFGWDRRKILSHPEMRQQVHPDDLKFVVEPAYERALRTGIYEYEARVIRPDKTIRWIRTQGKVIYSPEGEAVRMLGTMVDITEAKEARRGLEESENRYRKLATELEMRVEERTKDLQKANENLERSNAELAQYAFVASHDLQEPLRKIRVFSGMLNERKDLSHEARGTLSKVMSSAERMSLLIRDLLEFSRLLKSGRTFRETDLNEIIKNVFSDFELSIQEKNAEVFVRPLPKIEAVPLQMNQLFYNLVSNALKFIKPDGVPKITIQSHELNDAEKKRLFLHVSNTYYAIEFTDNGIGFEPQFSEQIFEIFKRLHTKHAYPGSGIGLALCRKIVENHGGLIFAESEEGKGAAFTIILPEKAGE